MSRLLTCMRDKTTLINFFVVAYAFTLPITKAGTVFFASLAIITWAISGNFRQKFDEIKESPLLQVIFLLMLLSTVAVTWSNNFGFWFSFMWKYWHFLMIPVIYTSIHERFVKHIFSAFLFGMLFSEIVSFGIFFELWSYKEVTPSNPTPFMDHVNYSIYLAFTALILLNRIFFEKQWWLIGFYSLYFMMVTANLFIIAGRTGQVAFIAGLLVIGILNIKNKLTGITIMLLLGAIITSSAYAFSTTFKSRAVQAHDEIVRMVHDNDFSGSLSQRISLWVMGIHVFLENPLLGTGIGNETSGVQKYVQRYGFAPHENVQENTYIDYHNAFVQYAAQLGIAGLILFIMVFVSLFRLTFTSTIYRNLNIAFIFLYVMLSMGGFSFHLMNSMVLFSLFAGIFISVSRFESGEHDISKRQHH